MRSKLKKIKLQLKTEFEWLKFAYPISEYKIEDIKIFDAKSYNLSEEDDFEETYEEKEIDGFIYNLEAENVLTYGICMIIDDKVVAEETDKIIMKKNKIKDEKHLMFYILYHEYGHLIEIEEILKEKGEEGLEVSMEEYDLKVEELMEKFFYGEITEKEMDKKYRELKKEEYADSFANKIYELRKDKIEQFFKKWGELEE